MTAEPSALALFWVGVIFLSLLVYVVLDGFDLGVGILFATTRDRKLRSEMMGAIEPFWDGNEKWLVVVGASLFAAFPAVYAVFLGAFYIPVLLLLFGLIFRGVAFAFRGRAGSEWLWDWGFGIGSIVVAFVQGAAVGAILGGVRVENHQYVGGPFEWLRPLPIVCGVGLVFGYALLGACWLILKSDADLRDWAYRRIDWLAGVTAALLTTAGVGALMELTATHAPGADRPWALIFPILAAAALLGVVIAARTRRDELPFLMAALFIVAAFLTLPSILWPYLIPYELTVADAASPDSSLSFFFWGAGLVALPVVAAYTILVYWTFRGKQKPASAGYSASSVRPAGLGQYAPADHNSAVGSLVGEGAMAVSLAEKSPAALWDAWEARAKWEWTVAIGVILVILGFVALGSIVAATVAGLWIVAVAMVVGGVAEIAHGFAMRRWAKFFFWTVIGCLYVIAGE
ncbi:cytochrome d ubiquinol oxidase subunit II [Methylocystis sp. WRRC1]|uniref:cytochrome d ubiquinol oxidase subunit II n=1 Tax=Methylocystis sp. WRRC1 TaxID=1732014 RepID=UPI001D13281D|nr:cytochrome d ubiquinol oxidase subunit II [Methylocystis sp. WRRC1]MCC3246072.1 cytochrome d ubiquinol oxidase subunit II [Methylocystis sp. WRRC1]